MENFKITKEQVLKIYDATSINNQEELKQWFPDAFKKELEVGKWYKGNVDFESLIFITEIEKRNNRNNIHYYGFIRNYRNKDYIANTVHEKSLIEATEKEVKTALINEAKKKYPIGTNINCLVNKFNIRNVNESSHIDYYFDTNYMYFAGTCIFDNGKWATVVETITKEEAEKLLNKKII